MVQCGSGRLRVSLWRGHPHIAHLAPVPGRGPSEAALAEVLDGLARQGYREALTSALTVTEQESFTRAGFVVHERLHLLRRELRDHSLPTTHDEGPRTRLRRARRGDRPRVLDVDRDAFASFWRLDETGLVDALSATPTVRFRVAHGRRSEIRAYAVWGRSGPVSYLQRLAVAPQHQGHGIGTALVVDGLAWSRRRGADHVLVNTQEENAAALGLYERLGFRRQEHGLAVLSRTLDSST